MISPGIEGTAVVVQRSQEYSSTLVQSSVWLLVKHIADVPALPEFFPRSAEFLRILDCPLGRLYDLLMNYTIILPHRG